MSRKRQKSQPDDDEIPPAQPRSFNDNSLRYNFGGEQFNGDEAAAPIDYSGYHADDTRPEQRIIKRPSRDNDIALQDKLIDIILNHKKDIRFAPSAEYRAGAARYAKANGLRLGPENEDINNDGVKDVILYNKAGVPVVINGYHVKPSKTPFRKMYKDANPTALDRIKVGGYAGYMNKQWGATPTVDETTGEVTFPFNADGKRKVDYSSKYLPDAFSKLKDKGWTMPQAPRRELSFYQMCMQKIGNEINNKLTSDIGYFSNRYWAAKCIPPLQIRSCVYTIIIDGSLINTTPNLKNAITSAPTADAKLKALKNYKDDHKTALKRLYQRNQAALFSLLEQQTMNAVTLIFSNVDMSKEHVINQSFDSDFNALTSKVKIAELKATTKLQLIAIIDAAKESFINGIQ